MVVETDGAELYVGRCDDIDGEGVHLKDADRHVEGEGAVPREEFLSLVRRSSNGV